MISTFYMRGPCFPQILLPLLPYPFLARSHPYSRRIASPLSHFNHPGTFVELLKLFSMKKLVLALPITVSAPRQVPLTETLKPSELHRCRHAAVASRLAKLARKLGWDAGAVMADVFAAAFETYRLSLTLPAIGQRPPASPDELRTAVDEFFPEDGR